LQCNNMGGLFAKKRKDDGGNQQPKIKVSDGTKGPAKQAASEKTYTFKVLTIGDCGVGKSSLMLRYVKGIFQEEPVDSVGYDSLDKTTTVDNKTCNLRIWDTAGQQRFSTITSSYYRGAHIILVVFDLTKTQSFENVQQWLLEVDRYASDTSQKLVVGTKTDLESEKMVNADDVGQFCSNRGLTYVETSAKTGHQVDYVFNTACHEMLEAIKGGTSYGDED